MSKISQFIPVAALLSFGLISPVYGQQVFAPIVNQQGFSVNCLSVGAGGACTKYSQLISNATGRTFIPVGYNDNFGYYTQTAPDGLPAAYHYLTDGYPAGISPMQYSGANTVRLWTGQWAGNPTQAVGTAFPAVGYDSQTAGYAQLIKVSLQDGLVPILAIAQTNSSEYWPSDPSDLTFPVIRSSTGAWSVPRATLNVVNGNKSGTIGLSQSVSQWITPQMLALLKANPNVIVNISNEWGQPMSTVNPLDTKYNTPIEQYWANCYKYAINVLRAAGMTNALMVDATGGGSYADGIIQDGVSIENSDPLHKVIFSAHAYSIYSDSKDCGISGFTNCSTVTPNPYQYDLATELNALANAGVPVDIGEFSNGYFNGNNYNYKNLVTLADQYGIGWQYWLYGNPGDPFYEQPYLNGVMYTLDANPNYRIQPNALISSVSTPSVPMFAGASTAYPSGDSVSSTNVPFEFSPIQGFILGLPCFLGLRYLKKKNKR